MLTVNPHIAFRGNCRDAVEFYIKALDAQIEFIQTMGESPLPDLGPAGYIMHCTLKIGNAKLMMSDDPNPQSATEPKSNICLAIGLNHSERAKQLFENLSENGTVLMPLEKTFWAEAFGVVQDQFGVKWKVNCESTK